MPSFDIVSELDCHEIQNAVDNANRELQGRFDFRGVDASFSLDEQAVLMKAEADFQLQQMQDMLTRAWIKRKLDPRAMSAEDVVHSGKTFSQRLTIKQGIDTAVAKQLVKLIKDSKLKVQASIQGDKVRISGKKRDDLQAVIALIREQDLGQPFQFVNFRD